MREGTLLLREHQSNIHVGKILTSELAVMLVSDLLLCLCKQFIAVIVISGKF